MNADHPGADSTSPDMGPIASGTSCRRWRGLAIAIGIAVVTVLTVVTVAPLAIRDHRSIVPAAERPDAAPLQRWWAESHGDVEALQGTIYDTQHALAIRNPDAVAASCQRMHDAGELTLKARLPAPDPVLTTDLAGAIEDAHAAAHLCLAAEAGSLTNYAGEFHSDLEQAVRQLQAAQDLVNKLMTAA